MVIRYLLIACCAVYTSLAWAQYEGGIEDGHSLGNIVGVQLNGQVTSFSVLFQGNDGDGYDRSLGVNLTLGGQQPLIYNGGIADGSAIDKTSQTIGGLVVAVLYQSGDGDGFSVSQSQPQILSGEDLTQLYNGSDGDGYVVALLPDTLLDGFMTMLYEGGDGDGHVVALLPDTVLQGFMTMLFEGGDGDGYAVELLSGGLLEGVLADIFNGGDGDGYARFELTTTALTLDVIDVLVELKVLLYPNPASDIVRLELPPGIIVTQVKMFDISGQEVPVDFRPDNTLDVSRLPAGLYLVSIISDDKKTTKKLVVK